MSGKRLAKAIRCARNTFFAVEGKKAPALTVASLATIICRREPTDPIAVTTPALSLFLAAANRLRDTGGRVVFADAAPHVRNLLARLRLTLVLHTADGLEKALADLKA